MRPVVVTRRREIKRTCHGDSILSADAGDGAGSVN